MSGRFAVGVVVGGLAAFTPFLFPAVLVVGLWGLYVYGLDVPEGDATAGVLWVSAWTTVLTAILIALSLLLFGLWVAPRTTLTAAGTLLVLAALHRRMKQNRGAENGIV